MSQKTCKKHEMHRQKHEELQMSQKHLKNTKSTKNTESTTKITKMFKKTQDSPKTQTKKQKISEKTENFHFFSKALRFVKICYERGATGRHRRATGVPPAAPPAATGVPPACHRRATGHGTPQAHTFA